ncbi:MULTISPECIES: isochorismate synthase [Shewanella]|uniref:isochorismate synthase n=1 Tax=Shewanella TaxID=22 RepID=UPI001C65EE45|nr:MULTISPECIES: isochorismate synthase [Shewanella]QYJ75548.1 isochorismate synthase [Shewanella sp. FJAT-52076]QYK05404.1 isochorismate synthase [Shewanella zhangzhouensis]
MSVMSLPDALLSLEAKIQHLSTTQGSEPLVQLTEAVPALPLISWLASQELYPRIYWHGRDKEEEVAAIGCTCDFFFDDRVADQQLAEVYQRQRALSYNQNFRYYGGVAFDREVEGWPEFGRARFVLPRIELRRSGKEFKLLLNLNFDGNDRLAECQAALQALRSLKRPKPLTPPGKVNLLGRSEYPEYPRWQQLVEQVTADKFNRHTPKVVLSRLSQLEINDPVDPWMVLACWQGRCPSSFQFGFQFSKDRTFISCSPERLYLRRGQELFTEALAGTTLRGHTEEEDALLAKQLQEDSKNSHENQLVRQHIVEHLSPLSHYVGAEESPRIFKLPHIQHLHRAIRAELKPGINDFQLLLALHPTPAVGGLPRPSALSFIRQQEGYNRGWYAGACGYLNRHESEFSVAIRSALIEPGRINLFAGAGIVAGSDPEAEWQELDNKLATILSILVEL